MDSSVVLSCYHREQLDNPLDDDAMIGTQLDQMSTIARLVYGKTCTLLIQLFDEVAARYQEQIQQITDAWQLIEGSWLPLDIVTECNTVMHIYHIAEILAGESFGK